MQLLDAKAVLRAEDTRVSTPELIGRQLHLRIRHAERHTGLQACGGDEIVGLVVAVRVELKRTPKVGGRIGRETGRENAHDRIRLISERDGSPDNARIAAEAPLPESVAKDDDMAAVWAIFFRRKRASRCHLGSEKPEIVFGNVYALDLLRKCAAGQIEAGPPKIVSCDFLKNLGLLLPDVELRHRRARA